MLNCLRGSEERPPLLLEFRSSKTFIIVVVASAVFTDIFAYGIVVPVFPYALTERAGIDPDKTQKWISIFLAVYGAALLLSSPIVGYVADRMQSRQWPFIVGLVLLGASTAMLCVGDSIAVFAAGRVLQGASATVVWVVGLALLVDTVGPDEIGIAMGYVGLAMSLALLLAPLLGGVVYQYAGYYSVYAMAFSLIVLDVTLRVLMIEKKNAVKWLPEQPALSHDISHEQERCTVDLEKHVSKAAAEDVAEHKVLSRERSLSQTRQHAPPPPEEAQGIVKKISHRLPPVVFLLGSRRMMCALWCCVIQSSLFTSFDTILPLHVKNTFAWDATGAGLIFLPIVLASFIGPVIGKLSDKYGPRWFVTSGFILTCPTLILLRLEDHNTLGQKVLLCALLAITGIGLTLALTPIMAEIAYAVEDKTKRSPPGTYGKNGAFAQAYGLFNMAWAAGAMIGPLLAGLVSQAHGWGTATLILGCISIVTAIPAVIWTGGSMFKKRRKDKAEADV